MTDISFENKLEGLVYAKEREKANFFCTLLYYIIISQSPKIKVDPLLEDFSHEHLKNIKDNLLIFHFNKNYSENARVNTLMKTPFMNDCINEVKTNQIALPELFEIINRYTLLSINMNLLNDYFYDKSTINYSLYVITWHFINLNR